MNTLKTAVLVFLLEFAALLAHAQGIAVIGHAALPKLDVVTLQKLYTGKIVQVDGQATTVIHLPPGNPLRDRFLATFLNQSEEKYTAYWTVRRFIGKGTPPQELTSNAAIIEFVQTHPGAIAYIDATEIKAGMNVLHKK